MFFPIRRVQQYPLDRQSSMIPPASLDTQQGPERLFHSESVRIQSVLLVNGLHPLNLTWRKELY